MSSALIDATADSMWVLFNANDEPVDFDLPGVGLGRPFELHPVQAASADAVVRTSTYDTATATFAVPGRTTSVFIAKRAPGEQIDLIIDGGPTGIEPSTVLDLSGGSVEVLRQGLGDHGFFVIAVDARVHPLEFLERQVHFLERLLTKVAHRQ